MIQVIETKDHELLAALNEEVQNLHFRMHPDLFKPFDKVAVSEAFSSFLAKDNCRAYVALKGGEAVGYIILFVNEGADNAFKYAERILYIDQVGVKEAYKKQGIANMLMEQAEALAKELSISKLELDHWSINEVAAAYFRNRGYTLCKERLWKTI